MNRWNQVHATIRRCWLVSLIFVLGVLAIGTTRRDPLPESVVWLAWVVGSLAVVLGPLSLGLYARARDAKDPAPAGKKEARCGFCRRGARDVATLIAGPEEYICDGCVEAGYLSVGEHVPRDDRPSVRCSFCREERSVGAVWLRGSTCICGSCVATCRATLRENNRPPSGVS
jgi:ClpX C4-type zinc finger